MSSRMDRNGSRLVTLAVIGMTFAAGCGSGSQGSSAVTASARVSEAPSQPASLAPSVPASASPSAAAISTVVIPSTSPEPALTQAWAGHGSTLSQPCTYSPTVDGQGRIWVAICWESKFWIFQPDGTFVEAWGDQGSQPGQFDFTYPASHDSIGGIAFAPDGSFYTFDAGNLRVQHFDAKRHLLLSWGAFGSGPGQFTKPTSIAVDGAGLVYVGDGARADIQVFDADGTLVRTIGQGAGQPGSFVYIGATSSGEVLANQGSTIVKYGPDGTPTQAYDLGAITQDPSCVAATSTGGLVVAGRGENGPEPVVALGATGAIEHVWPGVGECIALSPDGKAIYATDVESPSLTSYELPST
jgi:hypothetical protein